MPHSTRLVLDTNTVMALWFFEDPRLVRLRTRIEAGHMILACRDDALEELRRVLAYHQFGIAPERQASLLDSYRARIEPAPAPALESFALPVCRDRDDQKFLEIARDTNAALLLTRDKALLRLARHRLVRERFGIVTPEQYVAETMER